MVDPSCGMRLLVYLNQCGLGNSVRENVFYIHSRKNTVHNLHLRLKWMIHRISCYFRHYLPYCM